MLRSLSRVVLLAVATVLALFVSTAGPAAASPNTLSFVDPVDGAKLDSPPAVITLVFGQPINPSKAQFAIIAPNGAPATGPVSIAGLTASIKLLPGPAGLYTVSYNFTSTQGTPTSGATHFTLSPAAAKAAAAAAAGSTAAPGAAAGPASSATATSSAAADATGDNVQTAAQSTSSQSSAWWLWVVIAVLVVAAAAAVVVIQRRRARA